jgi:hypothetical protein
MQVGRRLKPPEMVDPNCLLVCDLHRLAHWATLLGRPGEARSFETRGAHTVAAIRNVLWDDEEQFFYGEDAQPGRPAVREWYDPDTGKPHGSLNYGWSAGVGIDLMMTILRERVEG